MFDTSQTYLKRYDGVDRVNTVCCFPQPADEKHRFPKFRIIAADKTYALAIIIVDNGFRDINRWSLLFCGVLLVSKGEEIAAIVGGIQEDCTGELEIAPNPRCQKEHDPGYDQHHAFEPNNQPTGLVQIGLLSSALNLKLKQEFVLT